MKNFDYGKFHDARLPTEEEIKRSWASETTPPLVSFLCTTYNHESYIEDTVRGFLTQETDFPFEIIIHDDASTDKTQKILGKIQKQYPSIIKTILQEENQYSKGKRILLPLMKHAQGKYIAICEGDDFWIDPQKISKQVSFLEENPDYVITYTDCQPFNECGNLEIDFGGARRDLSKTELQEATPIFTLTTCFRNTISDQPESGLAKYGDLFMWSMLGMHGKGKYLPEILPSRYRVHRNGLHSMTEKKAQREMALLTYAALFAYHKRIKNHSTSKYFKRQIIWECMKPKNLTEVLALLASKSINKHRHSRV